MALLGAVIVTFMHRLEQMRRGLRQRLGHADPPGGAEGELGAVDAVVGAVDQGHRDVDHRKAERALGERVLDAGLDRGDPLLGDHPAGDLVVELEAVAARQRLHLDHAIAELAVAARLLLVAAALGDGLADRFLVADRRLARIDRHAVAPLEPLERRP